MSNDQREAFLKARSEEGTQNKRQKTSDTTDFKVSEFYVNAGRDPNAENLWGKDEKFNMEDLTLHMAPDDEKGMLKEKQKLKWDKKKKVRLLVQGFCSSSFCKFETKF